MSDDTTRAQTELESAQQRLAEAAASDRENHWDEFDRACSDFWDARLQADRHGL